METGMVDPKDIPRIGAFELACAAFIVICVSLGSVIGYKLTSEAPILTKIVVMWAAISGSCLILGFIAIFILKLKKKTRG